jgi:hypothetical protein
MWERLPFKTYHSPNQRLFVYFSGMGRQKAPQGAFLLTFVPINVIMELTNINKHMNKYKQWYANITERAKNRHLDSYTESHHIVPRSLGGGDEADNLVDLTAREHFVCHWLLVKMTAGQEHHKMLNALRMMRAEKQGQQRYNTKITARVYENIKQEYAKLQSKSLKGKGNGFYGKTHTPEAREKIRQKNLGNKLTPEQHARLVANTIGKKKPPITNSHRAKLSAAQSGKNNPRYGVEVSEETRAKISEKAKGRKQSAETVQKKADAIRGLKREKLLCPHCDRLVAVNGYARWHGANCKNG